MECRGGRGCPYLNGGEIWGLLRERDYLRERIAHLEGLMGLTEAKIRELTEENKSLTQLVHFFFLLPSFCQSLEQKILYFQ